LPDPLRPMKPYFCVMASSAGSLRGLDDDLPDVGDGLGALEVHGLLLVLQRLERGEEVITQVVDLVVRHESFSG
jgi:hypothetical protein